MKKKQYINYVSKTFEIDLNICTNLKSLLITDILFENLITKNAIIPLRDNFNNIKKFIGEKLGDCYSPDNSIQNMTKSNMKIEIKKQMLYVLREIQSLEKFSHSQYLFDTSALNNKNNFNIFCSKGRSLPFLENTNEDMLIPKEAHEYKIKLSDTCFIFIDRNMLTKWSIKTTDIEKTSLSLKCAKEIIDFNNIDNFIFDNLSNVINDLIFISVAKFNRSRSIDMAILTSDMGMAYCAYYLKIPCLLFHITNKKFYITS